MLYTDRAFLRLHVEAVWGVQLPSIVDDDVVLIQDAPQPSWKLYVAKMADGTDSSIHIWRSDVGIEERSVLLKRGTEALTLPSTGTVTAGISREVALHLAVHPVLEVATAQKIARFLTEYDQALVETFEPGSAEYYFRADRYPLVGVFAEGQLLSLAHSSRRTAEACELGIDTLPQARRKGYALAATIVWAATVAQEGLVPLYSALAENAASLALAVAAGYRAFARAVTVDDC